MAEYKIIDLKDTSFGETAVLPNFMSETIDDIHNNMLSNASDDVSKIEGDFFWDATRSAAIAIDKINNNIKYLFQAYMIDFAEGYFLDELTKTKFISRNPSTQSIIIIEVEYSDSIALRNSTEEYDTFNDEVTFYYENKITGEKIPFVGLARYTVLPTGSTYIKYIEAKCEIPGSIGNLPANSIVTVDPQFINVFKSIKQFGNEEETDEELRSRLKELYKSPPSCGSKSDYTRWCLEVEGVYNVINVVDLYNNRAKLVVMDKNNNPVSNEVVNNVRKNIDEKGPEFQNYDVSTLIKNTFTIVIDLVTSQSTEISQTAVKNEFIDYCKEYLEGFFNDNYKAKQTIIKIDYVKSTFYKILNNFLIENRHYYYGSLIKKLDITIDGSKNKDINLSSFCYFVIDSITLNISVDNS